MESRKPIANIVFTKNRPLQLHGYLESLRRFFSPAFIQTYIIYKPELFDEEYERCFSQFPDCRVIRETDFHQNMLDLMDEIDARYILFGVDDVVYFDGVDFDVIDAAFETFGPQLFGFSLRYDRSQMQDDLQSGNLKEHTIHNQTVYAVDWTRGAVKSTRYPFELGGTIYRAGDVRTVIGDTMKGGDWGQRYLAPSSAAVRTLARIYAPFRRKFLKRMGYFFNPNTLESWNCKAVQRHPETFGHLLMFQKICSSAIAVNLVNTSTKNDYDAADALTVEALNAKYKDGCRFCIDTLVKNKPMQTHSGREYFYLRKTPCGNK